MCAKPGADVATRAELVAAAERDQEFETGARVISRSESQTGPARILTFSRGAYLRNLTLAQEGTTLVIRIRTPLMGLNGLLYELHVPEAIHEGVVTDILVRFRRGAVRVVIQTPSESRRVSHLFGMFSGGVVLRGPGPMLPGQAMARRLFILLLAIPPLLFLLGSAAPSSRAEDDPGRLT